MISWMLPPFCFAPMTAIDPHGLFGPEESRDIPGVFHSAGLLHPAPVHLGRDPAGGTPDPAQLCEELSKCLQTPVGGISRKSPA